MITPRMTEIFERGRSRDWLWKSYDPAIFSGYPECVATPVENCLRKEYKQAVRKHIPLMSFAMGCGCVFAVGIQSRLFLALGIPASVGAILWDVYQMHHKAEDFRADLDAFLVCKAMYYATVDNPGRQALLTRCLQRQLERRRGYSDLIAKTVQGVPEPLGNTRLNTDKSLQPSGPPNRWFQQKPLVGRSVRDPAESGAASLIGREWERIPVGLRYRSASVTDSNDD